MSQRLIAQLPEPTDLFHREIWLRYGAATIVTLLALAGAQLIVRTDFTLLLALITLLGMPVSLAIRARGLRVGSIQFSRTAWNGLTIGATFLAAGFYLVWTIGDLLEGWNGSMHGFWLRFGAGDSMGLLIQVFLIFAAFRSFALLSDKDCTLATVPSFSVLLLLIPVHKGIEVVIYFVMWTFWAAILFALDHRAEQRAQVVGLAASPIDAGKLAARSLGSVLAFSLIGAVGFSAYLATRDPTELSEAEVAITSLATRLTQVALSLPDVSLSGGPERQIDFSSGPSLPSQTVLWQTRAVTLQDVLLRPQYLRLFSLSLYDGTTWSQLNLGRRVVKKRMLTRSDWPLPLSISTQRKLPPGAEWQSSFSLDGRRSQTVYLDPRTALRPGFPIGLSDSRRRAEFGGPTMGVRQVIVSRTNNLGFLPLLPNAQTIRLPDSDQKEIRTRRDNVVDVGMLPVGLSARVFSIVPQIKEYGFPSGSPPFKTVAPRANTPILTPLERQTFLQLPSKLPDRVRRLGREMLRDSKPHDSNFKRASRLAFRLSEGAVYTLRPPAIPSDRDAADFFLFDGNKRGYCTYFAGALAVLCRTQGIPARVVTGFAGMEVEDRALSIVREANAHAWTEVWVENWGWAIVDATPAEDRGDNSPTWIENWGDVFGAASNQILTSAKTHWPFALLGAVLFSSGILGYTRRRKIEIWWSKRAQNGRESELVRSEVAQLYAQAMRPLARRFRARRPSETPDEWLRAALQAQPNVDAGALRTLTDLYLQAAFSPAPLTPDALQTARHAARNLRGR